MVADIETRYVVIVRSEAVGAGRAEEEPDRQLVALLRGINAKCAGARVFIPEGEAIFDPLGDDSGHHAGHERPFHIEKIDPDDNPYYEVSW